jgi:hypothetical protein
MISNLVLSPDTVISWFPENRDQSQMSDMDFYIVMSLELGFSSVEGKDRVTKNNDVIKDPITLNPIPPKQVVANYFEKRGWLKKVPGVDATGLKTLSSFSKDYEQKTGKTALGAEFYEALNKHTAIIKEFDWYN